MEKMNQAFEKVKILVGMEVDDEQPPQDESSFSFVDDFNRNCTLSTTQRLQGFAICFVAGLTFTLLDQNSGMMIGRARMLEVYACVLESNQVWNNLYLRQFALTWEILSWSLLYGSTAFLIGPKRQVTMMLDPVRIYATAIFIASMIIALFCALYVHNKLLTILAIILEFGALVWYSLSYIPFARSMVSKVMVGCFDTEF